MKGGREERKKISNPGTENVTNAGLAGPARLARPARPARRAKLLITESL